MAFEAGASYATLGVDLGELTRGFAEGERRAEKWAAGVENRVEKTGRSFSKIGSIATGIFTGIGFKAAEVGFDLVGRGASAAFGVIAGGIEDARAADQVFAQTENVIQSMGRSSELSADQIADMAGSLSAASGMSLFGDDDIEAGENMLLTFANITDQVPRATQAMVDMTQFMGGDMVGAATMLGKALDNPTKGLSALSRVGVSFSQEQKDLIATMQEAGDISGAQGVILDALASQFGGAAKAAANADGGVAQFQDRMGELGEELGHKAIPAVSAFFGLLNSPRVQAGIETVVARLGDGIMVVTDLVTALTTADRPMDVLIARVDDILPGFRGTVTVVARLAGLLSDNLVPALITVGSVMLAMGIRQLPILTAQIIAGTTAWTGYGVAMGILAAGPFVLVGAAVFALTKTFQRFNKIYADGTKQLLESRTWWTDSTDALDRYTESAAASSKAVQPLAARLEDLRAVQEAEITSLAKRQAAGAVTEDQWKREMTVINARAEAIQSATADLNLATQATEAATYAAEHGTVPAYIAYLGQALPAAAGEASAAITQLSDEDLDKLTQKLESAAEEGTRILGDWINTTLSFRDEFANAATEHWAAIAEIDKELAGSITQDRRTELETQRADLAASYQQEQADRAVAYANESAALRAHLGEMLIETVNGWVLMGKVPAERAAEMTQALATEYGVQASNAQLAFGQVIGILQNWSTNAGTSTASVIGDLQEAGQTALDTETQMNNLTGEYTATLVQNFLEGKIDSDEFNAALSRLPHEVSVQIQTNAAAVAASVDAANAALDRLKARANQTVRIHAEIDGPIETHSPSPMEISLANISEIIRTMPVLRLKAVGNVRDLLSGSFRGATRPLATDDLSGTFYDTGALAADAFVGGFVDSRPWIEHGVVDTSRRAFDTLRRAVSPLAFDTGGAIMDHLSGGFVDRQPLLGTTLADGISRAIAGMVDRIQVDGEAVISAMVDMAKKAGTAAADAADDAFYGVHPPSDRYPLRYVPPNAGRYGVHPPDDPYPVRYLPEDDPNAEYSAKAVGATASKTFAESWIEGLTKQQPVMLTQMDTTLLALWRESWQPWVEGMNERLELSAGFWMQSVADGISGSRSAIDAMTGMGHDMAAALTAAWGPPVLPPPIVSGSPVSSSVANSTDQSGSRSGDQRPIIIQQSFGPGTPLEVRQQARQGGIEGVQAAARSYGIR